MGCHYGPYYPSESCVVTAELIAMCNVMERHVDSHAWLQQIKNVKQVGEENNNTTKFAAGCQLLRSCEHVQPLRSTMCAL